MQSLAFSILEEKCISRLFWETRNNALSLWDALVTLISPFQLSVILKGVLWAWCQFCSEYSSYYAVAPEAVMTAQRQKDLSVWPYKYELRAY